MKLFYMLTWISLFFLGACTSFITKKTPDSNPPHGLLSSDNTEDTDQETLASSPQGKSSDTAPKEEIDSADPIYKDQVYEQEKKMEWAAKHRNIITRPGINSPYVPYAPFPYY